MKNESKKANAKLTSVLAAVLIIVVAIVAVIAVKTKDSGSLGTYSCEIMSSDNSSTVFEITFNDIVEGCNGFLKCLKDKNIIDK